MIVKTNLRDQVRQYLLQRMREGGLKRGRTINLAALSRELNVSVTPIREALTQLQQARIIEAVPNRGFIISELTVKEAKDLYGMVADLEVMALENSVFFPVCIEKLKQKQDEFKLAEDRDLRIRCKLEFHRALTQYYENDLARGILDELRTRIFFYEQALVLEDSIYYKSQNQYDSVIAALEEDNVPTAALILKMNWMLLLDYVENQLNTR